MQENDSLRGNTLLPNFLEEANAEPARPDLDQRLDELANRNTQNPLYGNQNYPDPRSQVINFMRQQPDYPDDSTSLADAFLNSEDLDESAHNPSNTLYQKPEQITNY